MPENVGICITLVPQIQVDLGYATLIDGWLGLSADEGRGKPRYAPARRMQSWNRGFLNWTSLLALIELAIPKGKGTRWIEAS